MKLRPFFWVLFPCFCVVALADIDSRARAEDKDEFGSEAWLKCPGEGEGPCSVTAKVVLLRDVVCDRAGSNPFFDYDFRRWEANQARRTLPYLITSISIEKTYTIHYDAGSSACKALEKPKCNVATLNAQARAGWQCLLSTLPDANLMDLVQCGAANGTAFYAPSCEPYIDECALNR